MRELAMRFKFLVILLFVCGLSFAEAGGAMTNRVNIHLDEKTAIAIAKEIFRKVYGESCVTRHEPFIAEGKKDSWVIRGSLKRAEANTPRPKMTLGGVPEIEIRKRDCCVLHLTHYK